jgi:hypothetical protein
MACVDCKDNIINKTPSLIGEPKCGSDCPPETTCDGGYIASTCVYYSGNNLACTEINYGDTLSEVIQQLDNKYGVRVTSDDNCCGFLNDKLIVGEGLVKEIVVQGGCEKLQITATGECQELEWLNILLTEPFTTVPTPSGIPELIAQIPQYAVDPCNGKVWLRGAIYIPEEFPSSTFTSFFTLPVTPLFSRSYLNVWIPQNTNNLKVSTLNIVPDGIGGSYATIIVPAGNLFGYQGLITLDGYSFETN